MAAQRPNSALRHTARLARPVDRRGRAPHPLEPPVFDFLQVLERAEPPGSASAATNASSRLAAPLAWARPRIRRSTPPQHKRRAAGDLARRSPRQLTTPPAASVNASSPSLASAPSRPGDLGRDNSLDRAAKGAILDAVGAALGLEMESGESADEMALNNHHRPFRVDAARALAQAAQERRWSARSRHQRLVQRVGEPVLEASRRAWLADRRASRRQIPRRQRRRTRARRASSVSECRRRSGRDHDIQSSGSRRSPARTSPRMASVLVLRRLAESGRLANFRGAAQIGAIAAAPDDQLIGRAGAASSRPGFLREPQSRRRRRRGEQRISRQGLEIKPRRCAGFVRGQMGERHGLRRP